MGFFSDAVCNYLLRLGWSHGNDEIISRDQAIEWFDLNAVNKGAARFDMDKMRATNTHYMQNYDDQIMIDLLKTGLAERVGREISDDVIDRLRYGLPGLKQRSKTILELIEKAEFYTYLRPISIDPKAQRIFNDSTMKRLAEVRESFLELTEWREDLLEVCIKAYIQDNECTMSDIAQALRIALTGTTKSPGIFEVLVALGRDEALGRIRDVLEAA